MNHNVKEIKTVELVSLFNRLTTGAKVKKFATRAIAEARVQKLLDAQPKALPKGETDTDDLVSLKEICREIDMNPRIARRLLRGSSIKRAAGRWEFDTIRKAEVVDFLTAPAGTPTGKA